MERRRFRLRFAAGLTAGALALTVAPALASVASPESPPDTGGGSATVLAEPSLVAVVVPDQKAIDRLNAAGYDLAEYTKPVSHGIEINVVATPEELAALRADGYTIGETITSPSDVEANRTERAETIAAINSALAADVDLLTVLRAEHFTSLDGQRMLNFEARTSSTATGTAITVEWDSGAGTQIGSGGAATLSRFTDAGVYMYHRTASPIATDVVPTKARFTSSLGATTTVDVTEWLGDPQKKASPHYVSDFVDHYMDPTEVYRRIQSLAAEFPKISELVDLPNKTNGYRRHAQVQVGATGAAGFYLTSKAWGHEGGNDISLTVTKPDGANSPLSVSVSGTAITVHLATNTSGAAMSTAAQVVGAINADGAAAALAAATANSTGAGTAATLATTKLSDGLTAPDSVSRDPFQMQALRIGTSRNGSKPGVLLYCQEHAREWVTPLVCVETAERLLRNYQLDPTTRKLVNDLDVFIIPSVNPDGAHYSMYDYASQRKNMVNYCTGSSAAPGNRNRWGVDLNRNFSVGSYFDGFTGGGGNCTGETYSGPAELSEPEARNEVWMAQTFPNIKFAMNTHSYGGYFMWPPGAYKSAGRVSLPPVDLGTDEFFWAASSHILSSVQKWRGTAIWPGRTGPVIDVLYSAAGNSADEFWYNYGVIGWDFEVGADIYDPAAKRYRAVGFQPNFAEGHEEAMEFASGQIGILEVARAYATDRVAPKSSLVVTKQEPGSATFTIETDEPASVYYTLDGSRPTFSSPRWESAGMREGAGSLTLTSTTEVKWFSVDLAGNAEKQYSPSSKAQNYRHEVVKVK